MAEYNDPMEKEPLEKSVARGLAERIRGAPANISLAVMNSYPLDNQRLIAKQYGIIRHEENKTFSADQWEEAFLLIYVPDLADPVSAVPEEVIEASARLHQRLLLLTENYPAATLYPPDTPSLIEDSSTIQQQYAELNALARKIQVDRDEWSAKYFSALGTLRAIEDRVKAYEDGEIRKPTAIIKQIRQSIDLYIKESDDDNPAAE